jgi:endo-alpha-1,4-polygalactosaminidase (GH114 family)
MVFEKFREKVAEKAVFGMVRRLPGGAKNMARAAAMKKTFDALNEVEKNARDLLVCLKSDLVSNDSMRKALKLKDFIKENKRLFSSEEEQKEDLLACEILIDCLVKEEEIGQSIFWLDLFLKKFSEFKKRLAEFFEKVLPV